MCIKENSGLCLEFGRLGKIFGYGLGSLNADCVSTEMHFLDDRRIHCQMWFDISSSIELESLSMQ